MVSQPMVIDAGTLPMFTVQPFLGKKGWRRWLSHQGQIFRGRLATPTVGHELEADLLAFPKIADAGALNRTDVDEGIIATIIRRDEAEALFRVKPLYGSRSHGKSFLDRHKTERKGRAQHEIDRHSKDAPAAD